ncbi:MAG: NAD(P)-dependent oxidoreductase [Acidimicrobiaceae bacterium]|nr:NAD(P)-dependent oxidoreductase [Acidimicrobiaceae bacterium]
MIFGLLHPGEMGASCGALLRKAGHDVIWASDGRGPGTQRRALDAGLRDVGTVGAMVAEAEAILSVCPPAAALDVASKVAGFSGLYVDANAVAPTTVRRVAYRLAPGNATVVDGGIIGPPPDQPGRTRLYLSGPHASEVAAWWDGTNIEARVVGDLLGAASALKAAYATWTKASAAMLLAIRAVASAEGVDDALLAEWAQSQPGLDARSAQALRTAESKGWRWVGEMEEIGDLFEAAGQPPGFLRAAAEVYRGYPRPPDD